MSQNSRLTMLPLMLLMLAPLGAATMSENEIAEMDGIEKIEINMRDTGGVSVGINVLRMSAQVSSHSGNTLEARFTGEVHSNFRDGIPHLILTKEGSTLKLEVGVSKKVLLMLIRWGELALDVKIPDSYVGDLEVTSSAYGVTLENLKLRRFRYRNSSGRTVASEIEAEEAVMRSSSGSVQIDGLRTGRFSLEGSSGRITLQGLEAEEASVTSSSGRIEASRIEAKEMILKSSSGSVQIDGLHSGRFSCDASSGRVTLRNLEAEEASIETSSGKIMVEDLRTRTARLENSSGGIELRRGEGALTLKTSSGAIEADLSRFDYPAAVEATSGSIRLNLPRDAAFDLKAHTTSGKITCGFPLTITPGSDMGSHDMEGSVQGGGPRLDVSASSGSIHIERN